MYVNYKMLSSFQNLTEAKCANKTPIKTTSANFLIPHETFVNRYYHDNRNFMRLLTMLSNEVVARARQLVGEHVLENLLAVGSCFQSSLRSWRDFVRKCFCFGSEAVNASGEAVRGLVKSQVGISLAASPLKISSRGKAREKYGGLARSRIPPATQATFSLKCMYIHCMSKNKNLPL